jgi:hypothetical protein
MKRCLLALLFAGSIFHAAPSYAAYVLTVHTIAMGTATSVTTSTLNTSGSDLCVLETSRYYGGGASNAITITDNKSNSFTALTDYFEPNPNQYIYIRFYFAQNLTVGTGHTFTATCAGTACYTSIVAACFSGSGSSPLDQGAGRADGAAFVNSLQSGPITPTTGNQLVVSGLSYRDLSTATVDSSCTIIDRSQDFVLGSGIGIAMCYIVQTTAVAVNPTWSWTSDGRASANSATFKASGGTSAGATGNASHFSIRRRPQ